MPAFFDVLEGREALERLEALAEEDEELSAQVLRRWINSEAA